MLQSNNSVVKYLRTIFAWRFVARKLTISNTINVPSITRPYNVLFTRLSQRDSVVPHLHNLSHAPRHQTGLLPHSSQIANLTSPPLRILLNPQVRLDEDIEERFPFKEIVIEREREREQFVSNSFPFFQEKSNNLAKIQLCLDIRIS